MNASPSVTLLDAASFTAYESLTYSDRTGALTLMHGATSVLPLFGGLLSSRSWRVLVPTDGVYSVSATGSGILECHPGSADVAAAVSAT